MQQRSIAQLLVELQADTDGYKNKMAGVERRTDQADKRIKRSTESIGKRFGNVATRVAKLSRNIAALGAAIGGVALAKMGQNALNTADDLQTLSNNIGASTETIQGFRAALQDTADVTAPQADKMLERFARRFGEAATGSGQLKDVLERLGIATRDTEGEIRPMVDVLNDLSTAIANANSSDAAAIAADAFGREGIAAVDGLRKINGELDKLIAGYRETGRVIDSEVISRGARLSDTFQQASREVRASFNAGLLEGFVGETDTADANLKALAETALAAGKAVGGALNAMLELAGKVEAVFGRIQQIVDKIFASNVGEPGAATVRQRARETATQAQPPDLSSLFGSGTGSGSSGPGVAGRRARREDRFASGGAFVVSGASGQDKNLVSFLASAGEKVNITKGERPSQSPGFSFNPRGFDALNSSLLDLTYTVEDQTRTANDNLAAADAVGNAFARTAASAINLSLSFKDTIRAFAASLQQSLVSSAASGVGNLISGGLTSLLTGGGGVSVGPGFGGNFTGGTVGFASGGSFRVGGSAGMDNKMVSFKASPGEIVNVSKPGQMAQSSTPNITYQIDARGADASAVQRLEAVMRDHVANHDTVVAAGVKRAQSERTLSRRGAGRR